MVDCPDITNLTLDELVGEYCKLYDRYHDLCESNESDAQKIHELKRSLDTAIAAQAYLSQELEQYNNVDNKETEIKLQKTESELQDAKKKCSRLETCLANLQQEYSTLMEENSKITKERDECQKTKKDPTIEEDGQVVEDFLARIQLLENYNMDLLQKIDEFEERSVRYTLTIAECEKNIEILTDQITCLEENLQSKRADLEDKLQIIESTQEQLAEANSKIAFLSSTTDAKDRKGNSLFAEVDDQRQAMKQLLASQKKSYMQMKKIYGESEHEIRRLKRENISMRTEFEACSEIFWKADKIYQEKLNERVRNLLYQNDELEIKLKWTQEKLKEVAADKGVLFLDSILKFCKKETDELKIQLHSVRLQNASLEEQLRNAQQDMARWRFESLKSRCILIDREDLLTKNKISFKAVHAVEYKISEKDQQDAKPRIVYNRRNSISNRKSTSPLKAENPVNDDIPQTAVQENEILSGRYIQEEPINGDPISAESLQQEIVESEINKLTKTEIKTFSVKNIKTCESSSTSNNQNQNNENTENNIICLDDTPILDNFASLKSKPPSPPSPMRPSQRSPKSPVIPVRSILAKNDLLINTSKQVKFSAEANIVYNLTPKSESPVTSKTNAVSNDDSEKQPRTKSNIVVRRVVVSSKHN